MKNLEHYDERVWSRFFDFVFQDEENMSRSEVQKELSRMHIDMRQAKEKLHRALRHARDSQVAIASLQVAKEKRPALLARLASIRKPSVTMIKEALRKEITKRFSGSQQAVYARKLEEASEADLESMLDDVSLLDAFLKDSDDAKL